MRSHLPSEPCVKVGLEGAPETPYLLRRYLPGPEFLVGGTLAESQVSADFIENQDLMLLFGHIDTPLNEPCWDRTCTGLAPYEHRSGTGLARIFHVE